MDWADSGPLLARTWTVVRLGFAGSRAVTGLRPTHLPICSPPSVDERPYPGALKHFTTSFATRGLDVRMADRVAKLPTARGLAN